MISKPLMIAVLLTINFMCSSNSCAQGNKQDAPPTQQGDPPPSKYGGLQADLSFALKQFNVADTLLHFEKTLDKSQTPVYTATGVNNERVELAGTEHNLRRGKWTITYGTDKEATKNGILRMFYFVKTLSPFGGYEWFYKQLAKFNASPLSPFVTSEVVNADLLTCESDPVKHTISLTIAAQ